jgi:hypothetical protein
MRTLVLVAAVTTFHLVNSPSASAQTSRLTGLVRDFCGLVLPGATVTLVHESGNGARAVVDGEGRYSVATLVPGQWTVTFALLGFERQEQAIWLPEGGSLELNLRLPADPNLKEALTVTHEDPSIRYHKYSVHGLVTGSGGEPVAGATIRFREVGSTASRAVTEVCWSDELGRFLVSGWAPVPIRWRLSVEADWYVPYVHPDFELTSEESRAINFRLRPR